MTHKDFIMRKVMVAQEDENGPTQLKVGDMFSYLIKTDDQRMNGYRQRETMSF